MIPLAGQTLKSAHFLHPTAIAMGHRVMRVSFRDVELKFIPFATSGAAASCSLSRAKPLALTEGADSRDLLRKHVGVLAGDHLPVF